tara:strand:+ start:1389 stop:1646 length:258 start_codon:yes stop_codon:yes gene_type:complete
MAEEKLPNVVRDEDTPEGKMELQFRVLGNEMIGIKMIVDDMKMKWVAIGLVGILVMTWAAAEFSEAVMAGGSAAQEVLVIEESDG